MNVKDIMTSPPVTCAPADHLGTAVWRMWRADCGFLPVTSGDQVVGVITDRDAAVSLMLRGRKPEEILVGEVMQGYDGLVACDASDSVRLAMDLMQQHRIHRLPVLEEGALVGVVSLNDLALAVGVGGNNGRPTPRDIATTLQGISAHRVAANTA